MDKVWRISGVRGRDSLSVLSGPRRPGIEDTLLERSSHPARPADLGVATTLPGRCSTVEYRTGNPLGCQWGGNVRNGDGKGIKNTSLSKPSPRSRTARIPGSGSCDVAVSCKSDTWMGAGTGFDTDRTDRVEPAVAGRTLGLEGVAAVLTMGTPSTVGRVAIDVIWTVDPGDLTAEAVLGRAGSAARAALMVDVAAGLGVATLALVMGGRFGGGMWFTTVLVIWPRMGDGDVSLTTRVAWALAISSASAKCGTGMSKVHRLCSV